MLKHSFIHIPGIGEGTEKRLWERGIRNWQELSESAAQVFKPHKLKSVQESLDQSIEAYRKRDVSFFCQTLPRNHRWRLIPEFGKKIAYFDIETTGLGMPPDAHSTTITFYFNGEVLQEHEPKKKRKLVEKINREADLWVSYFGEVFDLPFLRRELDLELNVPHIDLCFWLRRHGFAGGLKKVQKNFPEIPNRQSMDIDGYDAVRLWRLHQAGVSGALETLLTYNAEDTVVLEPLLIRAFNLEVDKHPGLPIKRLPMREVPGLSTRIHSSVYSVLRQGSSQPSV